MNTMKKINKIIYLFFFLFFRSLSHVTFVCFKVFHLSFSGNIISNKNFCFNAFVFLIFLSCQRNFVNKVGFLHCF